MALFDIVGAVAILVTAQVVSTMILRLIRRRKHRKETVWPHP